ncbi:hypothetical protein I7I48_10129 [Histoplasma ohiense]|nr:hypothetical protein I7I48_10129 [Histoplasma ohiense (nom. inval.)]
MPLISLHGRNNSVPRRFVRTEFIYSIALQVLGLVFVKTAFLDKAEENEEKIFSTNKRHWRSALDLNM